MRDLPENTAPFALQISLFLFSENQVILAGAYDG